MLELREARLQIGRGRENGSGVYGIAGSSPTNEPTNGVVGIASGHANSQAALFLGRVGVNGRLSVAGDMAVSGLIEGELVSAENAPIVAGPASRPMCSGAFNCMASGVLKAVTLSVSGAKNFEIPHPLDPKHATLRHAAIEGPGMYTIYRGRVKTDANGSARVRMPDWFDALNRDLEYQLTTIGSFSRAMVAQEFHDGAFTIRTEDPGVTVSWLVTGERDDAYARAHPYAVEVSNAKAERRMP